MKNRLCLSPLTINQINEGKIIFSGPWCFTKQISENIENSNIDYEVVKTRILSREKYIKEANLCKSYYDKYIKMLSEELNRIHKKSYSIRYWNTLLNRFLYFLIAAIIDKYFLLKYIAKNYSNTIAGIINYNEDWINKHITIGLGGSRLMHLLIFSIIIDKIKIIRNEIIDSFIVKENLENLGDGKKDLRSKEKANIKLKEIIILFIKKRFKILSLINGILHNRLPLWMFKYKKSRVLALGDQYLLSDALVNLLKKIDGNSFYYYAKDFNINKFVPCQNNYRNEIKFPVSESDLDLAIQECIKILMPTVYLENFLSAEKEVERIFPDKKAVILNSQNYTGRELVDFYIAKSVEKNKSHHMMICHGGCYGAMEVSLQEEVWAQISDSYAIWSNVKSYSGNCETVKMPSLRFHKWIEYSKNRFYGNDILMFMTGHYPNRYAYNSIFPYTIDDTYFDWQIRFLGALSKDNLQSLVIRDYHRSSDLSQGKVQDWAKERGIRIDSSLPFRKALEKSKIAVQTVPQTTYLETISADHPTICYWNPEANMIRTDLEPYYNELICAGILHTTPESAADKLNQVADDPLTWWQSKEVREALLKFKENVCLTSYDAINQWADFIKSKI